MAGKHWQEDGAVIDGDRTVRVSMSRDDIRGKPVR